MKSLARFLFNLTVTSLVVAAFLYLVVITPQTHSDLLYAHSSEKIGVVTTLDQNGHGTGFFVQGKSGSPYIMTNVHVCKIIPNGGLFFNEKVKTSVMPYYKDQKADICLLKYPKNEAFPLPFKLGNEPTLNDDLWVMGYPLDHLKHFSKGAINGDRLVEIGEPWTPDCPAANTQQVPTFFGVVPICVNIRYATETSARIFPGNSGSPVLNMWGNLIGIVFAGNDRSNLGVMARFEDVKRVLETH